MSEECCSQEKIVQQGWNKRGIGRSRALETGKKLGSHSKMEVDLPPKERGITDLGFQEDLCGITGGGLEVGRDWSQSGLFQKSG